MGSVISREDVIASRWWEAKSRSMLITTTNAGKARVICSLIPFHDEDTAVGLLKVRPDLDTILALHSSADFSTTSNDLKASELAFSALGLSFEPTPSRDCFESRE